jgi:Glycosyltransferase Family 4
LLIARVKEMTEPVALVPSGNARIAENREVFEDIVGVARRRGSRGHYETAAGWAEIAADFAWKSPPGILVDDRLEDLLATVGSATVKRRRLGRGARSSTSDPPRSVLHVLTEAHPTGGHTRLVWRWIEADRSRRHAVVLTRQTESGNVPERLLAAPRASGGWVRMLNWRRFRPAARAEALLGFASAFDVVVLHTHPFDVVPAMAFAGSSGPPVVVLNHAGFSFWVGRNAADAVACVRPSNCDVAVQRRGLEPERCVLLPIPVAPPSRPGSKQAAREALGLPGDAVLLLTMAEAYKYVSFEPRPTFVDIVTELALGKDRVHVFAVGPNDDGEWRAARERTGGRVRAFGVRTDTDLFQRAADVYVDSFPMTSTTSFLEAGLYGVPVVSFCPHRDRAPIMCADDVSLEGLIVRAETPESFVATVGDLVEDGTARETLGRATVEAIRSGHGPAAFGGDVADVYARATSMHERGDRSYGDGGSPGPWDEYLAQMYAAVGRSVPVSCLVSVHMDSFPPGARTHLWLRRRLGLQVENGIAHV